MGQGIAAIVLRVRCLKKGITRYGSVIDRFDAAQQDGFFIAVQFGVLDGVKGFLAGHR